MESRKTVYIYLFAGQEYHPEICVYINSSINQDVSHFPTPKDHILVFLPANILQYLNSTNICTLPRLKIQLFYHFLILSFPFYISYFIANLL